MRSHRSLVAIKLTVGPLLQLDLEAASLHSTLSSLASVEGDCVTTSLQEQTTGFRRRVSVSGLHATYDEGLAFLKAQQANFSPTSRAQALPESPLSSPILSPSALPSVDENSVSGEEQRTTSIMWLGSSCGNYTREEAVDFLRNIDLREGDTMLIGIDGCADGPKIETAYNDPEVRLVSLLSFLEARLRRFAWRRA